MTYTKFLVICIIFCLLISCKQDKSYNFDPDKKFTVKELTDDLDYLNYVLTSSHPSLFDQHQRMMYDKLYNSTYEMVKQPMSLRDFYMLLAPVTARLNCGHTYLMFPEGYWDKMNEKYNYLPLMFFFNKNKVYVRHNFSSQPEIPEGAEIIEINGEPVQQIIYNLLSIMPSDGNIIAYKHHCMNELEFGLFPGYNHFPAEYAIKYKEHPDDSVPENVLVKSLPRDEIIKNRDNMNIDNRNYIPYSFSMIDSLNTPVITIREFAGYNNKEYKLFLKKTFEQINKNNPDNLVIDVRGNDGGDPQFAGELLSYIISSEIKYFSPDVYGYNNLKNPLIPKMNSFKGRVYILADGGCFSTTGHFLSVVKYNKTGIIIGNESGGTWICNGCYKEFILPNTGIKLLCPRCVYKTAVTDMARNRGVLPDIYAEQEISDITGNRDKALEVCLNIIRNTADTTRTLSK